MGTRIKLCMGRGTGHGAGHGTDSGSGSPPNEPDGGACSAGKTQKVEEVEIDERPVGQQGVSKRSPSALLRASICVERSLSTFFGAVGLSTGKNPYTYILLSLVLTAACASGLVKFTPENRSEKLWVPQDAEAQRDLADFRETFGNSPRSSTVILTSKIGDEGMANQAVLNKVLDLHQRFMELTFTVEGALYNYTDICLKSGSECGMSSPLALWDYNEATLQADSQQTILDRLTPNADGLLSIGPYVKSPAALVIGGLTKDSNDKVTSVAAFKLSYRVKNRSPDGSGLEGTDPLAEAFEREFIDLALAEEHAEFNVYVSADRSFSDEGGSAILGDVQLLSSGYMLIILYTAFNLGKCDCIQNKAALTMAGIGSIGLSIVACFGLSSALGQFYGPVHSVLPFILLGIGVDDMFIIVNAFQLTDENDDIPKRISHTLSHSGVSITVTTVTDLAAFAIGSTTVLPALSSFCVYAAVGISLDFLFQIIFFVPWLVIDAHRIRQRRYDCCCCLSASRKEPCCRCCQPAAVVDEGSDVESGSAVAAVAKAVLTTKDDRLGHLSRFLRDKYMPCILHPVVKVIVVIFFLSMAAFGVYGFTQLENDFDRNWFIPDDSYVVPFNSANDAFFSENGPPVYVVTKDIDYYGNIAPMHNLTEDIKKNKYMLPDVNSWMVDFITWINRTGSVFVPSPPFFNTSTEVVINPYKSQLVADPINATLQIPPTKGKWRDWVGDYVKEGSAGNRYQSDIKFADDGSIKASRFFCQYEKLPNARVQVAAMDAMREEVKGRSFKAYAFSFTFIFFEQFKIIERELWTNMLLAAAAVFVITTILIAHILTSSIVTICVCLTIVDLLGVMWIWGLTIDGVNVIQLTLAVGLAVDYSAHIGHAFMQQRGSGGVNTVAERERRITAAVAEIGASVINGGVSTFLAVLMLSVSRSYVFRSFFKVFFGIVVLGLGHGLMLLPVLLSYCGPSALQFSQTDNCEDASDA